MPIRRPPRRRSDAVGRSDGRGFRALTNGLPSGVVVLRLEDAADPGSLRLVYRNAAASRLGGPTLDDAVGKTLREWLPEALETDLPLRLADAARGHAPHEFDDIRGHRHSQRLYAVTAVPMPPDAVGVLFEDVTDERRAREMMRRAQELAHIGVWSWDIRSDYVTWCEEMYRIFGLTPDTFSATYGGWLEHVHPEDRVVLEQAVDLARTERRPFALRLRIRRPDNRIRQVDWHGDVWPDRRGAPIEVFGLAQDVTEHERTHLALRAAEDRFARTLRASPAAVCIVAADDGRIIEVNERFLTLVEQEHRAAVLGRPARDFGLWTDPAEREQLVADLRERRSVRERHVTFRGRDGGERCAVAALEFIEVGGRECVLAHFWGP